MDDATYRAVCMAALLHDVGKLLHRSKRYRDRLPPDISRSHPVASGLFAHDYAAKLERPDLVEVLAQHHHEGPRMREEVQVASIPDAEARILGYLLSRADNYASGERADTQATFRPFHATKALDCVFAAIRLAEPAAETATPHARYSLKPVDSPLNELMPAELHDHPEPAVDGHVSEFVNDWDTTLNAAPLISPETAMLLLEKWAWCVPSDTTRELADISLYDHLKTTCALAACSYLYHKQRDTLRQEQVTDDNLPRFLLVAGDVGGIQSYLYEIASTGKAAVAKRLRARSFYLSLLTEAVVLRLLRALDLPLACKLMDAGGQFFLLYPNTQQAKEALLGQMQGIQRWLWEKFQGALSISFATGQLTGPDLGVANFGAKLQEVKDSLNLAKATRFKDVVEAGDFGAPLQEVFPHGACNICDKFPSALAADEGERVCAQCRLDEDVGRWLPDTNRLAWLPTAADGERCVPFFEGEEALSACLLRPSDPVPPKAVLVINLREPSPTPGFPSAFRSYHVQLPYFAAGKDPPDHCRECHGDKAKCEAFEDGKPVAPKTFACLAAAADGDQYLGVLRADVDNLGLIFALGLEGGEQGNQETGRVSLSRLATMSRMLDYFFHYGVSKILGADGDFANIYMTYSGGDDLFVVGPWNVTIRFAKQLNQQFKKFVADNPEISLSAGIAVVKPHYPIARAAEDAGDRLHEAKAAGRNRISLFGESLTWDKLDRAQDWAEALASAVKSTGEGQAMARGFLYRLLQYGEEYRQYKGGDSRGALYRSHLAYDLRRNFYDAEGNPKIDQEVLKRLEELLVAEGESVMDFIKVPINWALLLTRGNQ